MLALSIATLLGRRPPAEVPAGFSPSELFANSEVGVWYDPSDFSTLYQNTNGTSPVTAVEQPVGLMLDKSQGLVLGSELDPGFAAYNTVLTGTWAASGGNYVFTDTVGSQGRPGVIWPSLSLSAGWYRLVISVASITGATQIRADGLGASDLLFGTGTHTFTVYVSTASTPRFRLEDASTTINDGFALSSVSVKALPGNHAVAANNGTARPVLKSAGGLYYLAFTTDDAMSTASINFSGTDEMTVFAGVTKNSDAATAILVELSVTSVTNAGSFYLAAPEATASLSYSFLGRGSRTNADLRSGTPLATYPAPITNVLTATGDISGDLNTIRVNGVAGTSATGDQGSGNFGNYPLYIGARNNSSLFFNGSLYSLIVRGKNSTATEIDDTEAWVANKTGVTL